MSTTDIADVQKLPLQGRFTPQMKLFGAATSYSSSSVPSAQSVVFIRGFWINGKPYSQPQRIKAALGCTFGTDGPSA